MLPSNGLLAFTEGEGTKDDPFIVTADDTSLDVGSYYLADSSVSFASTAVFYVGHSNTNNVLTISGADTTLSDTSATIGDGAASSGDVTVTDGAHWSNKYTLMIGSSGTGTLTIADGASVESGTSNYIGANYGSKGTVTVTGSGSAFDVSVFMYIGKDGGKGTLRIEDGGSVASTNTKLGPDGTGTAIVTGSGSTWDISSTFSVGYAFGKGTVTVSDGGTISCGYDAAIGGKYSGSTGVVSLYGKGSLWSSADALKIGTGEDTGTLRIANGALAQIVKTSGFVTGNNGVVELAGGYLALKGKTTATAAVAGYHIKVFNGTGYVTATASDLTATYYDGTTNLFSSSSLYADYAERIDLTGYTVITGGENTLAWADVEASDKCWYDSSWYGWFYTDTASSGNWIWHASHGWQYVFSSSTTENAFMWDDASASWWYINSAWYPYLYNYSTGRWYFYESGTTPSRKFWDYTGNKLVGESSL